MSYHVKGSLLAVCGFILMVLSECLTWWLVEVVASIRGYCLYMHPVERAFFVLGVMFLALGFGYWLIGESQAYSQGKQRHASRKEE
jgi:hypothetical protein